MNHGRKEGSKVSLTVFLTPFQPKHIYKLLSLFPLKKKSHLCNSDVFMKTCTKTWSHNEEPWRVVKENTEWLMGNSQQSKGEKQKLFLVLRTFLSLHHNTKLCESRQDGSEKIKTCLRNVKQATEMTAEGQKGSWCLKRYLAASLLQLHPKMHFSNLVLQERAWDGLSAKAVK